MPRKNVDCDQCDKKIRGEEIAWFSDREKDLDFCSESCYSNWTKISKIKNAQEYINKKYPTKEERGSVETLDLSRKHRKNILKDLEGELDLSDFSNLKKLKLAENKFAGSLEFLKNMTKLEELDLGRINSFFFWIRIENNFTFDLKYLPNSLKKISCNLKKEEAEKIEKELSIYDHNLLLWQADHPEIMEQAGREPIDLNSISYENAKLETVLGIPTYLQEEQNGDFLFLTWNKIKNFFNLSAKKQRSSLNCSKILLQGHRPFTWEKKTNQQISKRLPTRLYNVEKGKNKLDIKNRKELEKDVELTVSKEGELFPFNDNIKNYATMSYVCGTEQGEGEIYTNARKALNKVIKALELINQGKEGKDKINHVWIDQLCIIQDGEEGRIDKEIEIPKMRDYYNNSEVTFIAIDAEIGEVYLNDKVELTRHTIRKIYNSSWFKRSWTFQEGLLSKQTIFMFDDGLVDGRSLALAWGGLQEKRLDCLFSCLGNNSIFNLNNTLRILITPLGWSYGAKLDQNVNLNLGQALYSVKHRKQTVSVDGIYALLGLLPYGDKVKVSYKGKLCLDCKEKEQEQKKTIICQCSKEKTEWPTYFTEELEQALAEVVKVVIKEGYQEELLSWIGSRNENNWYIPQINENGSTNIERSLNEFKLGEFDKNMKISPQGIQLVGKRYVVSGMLPRYGITSLISNWGLKAIGIFQSFSLLKSKLVKVGNGLSLLVGTKTTLDQLKVGDSLVIIGEDNDLVEGHEMAIPISKNSDYPVDLVLIATTLINEKLVSQDLFIDLVKKKIVFETESITRYQQLVKELEKLETDTNEYIQKNQELDSLLEWNKWKGIHKDFDEELVKDWKSKGFSYEEVCKWGGVFNNEFSSREIEFYLWLRDVKKVSAEECGYNYSGLLEYKKQELRKQLINEFKNQPTREELITQIQIPPKK